MLEFMQGVRRQKVEGIDFFSANDIIKKANLYRFEQGIKLFNLRHWMSLQYNHNVIMAMEEIYGNVRVVSKDRSASTWMHPVLAIEIALEAYPPLKLKLYESISKKLLES